MADGELKISLDDETARRLKDAADAAGLSVGDYARDLIAESLCDDGDDDWSESIRALEEYDRTGESVSVEEAMKEFHAAVEERIAARAKP